MVTYRGGEKPKKGGWFCVQFYVHRREMIAILLEWLASIGVSPDASVRANLVAEQIDRQVITLLTDSQLERLGFKMGPRAKILHGACCSFIVTKMPEVRESGVINV